MLLFVGMEVVLTLAPGLSLMPVLMTVILVVMVFLVGVTVQNRKKYWVAGGYEAMAATAGVRVAIAGEVLLKSMNSLCGLNPKRR